VFTKHGITIFCNFRGMLQQLHVICYCGKNEPDCPQSFRREIIQYFVPSLYVF